MRRLGYLLIASGVLAATYVVLLLSVGDPITGLYANYEQRHLKTQLAHQQPFATQLPGRTIAPGSRGRLVVAGQRVAAGSPMGMIAIPRLGLNAVFVQGTRTADLDKAPGHYPNTSLPGSRRVVAIAAHRTTYGAWFLHIDRLRAGDPIYLDYKGRRFTYLVVSHRIVMPTNWSIIRYQGYPKLVLTSCDPVYSASHRYAVFARLTKSQRLKD